ncbi:MAG: YbhB/YbcL family Raf kinase inhibitor-like protein [Syntrophobacterales bacterium]|nr:YbhB/YbcL family Raf kinase inhibitor-like protein [Syntrophobacterales bacterium]
MFTLESSAFKNGDTLPKKYTIDGEKTSPPLKWEDVPKGTKSLALTVTDSDTPMGGIFVHWILYDIPAQVKEIAEGNVPAGAKQLPNSYAAFGEMGAPLASGYGPAWPPDKSHRYVFTLYALRVESLGITAAADYNAFRDAALPETLATTTLIANYGPAETPLPG